VANEDLTTLASLKDEFVANVSHELRTPITSIMLYHSLLEARPGDTSRFVVHLKRETERLARLIEDLLYISRLEQGRTNYVPDRLDLNRLVQNYIHDRTPLAGRHQLSLNMSLDPDLPPVFADEKMIDQVLSILLTNAMNYTPAGGTITVATGSLTADGHAWSGFKVIDNGPGINPVDQKHIFERFYRGKAGHESTVAGTGLGLSIARTIIDKHDGKLELFSAGVPGEGTTFCVWLPVMSGGNEK
jgi:signal transduction histidine kinase